MTGWFREAFTCHRPGEPRWHRSLVETLTAEQIAAGYEVVVATGQVQGDGVEDPGASSMSLVRLSRLGRATR